MINLVTNGLHKRWKKTFYISLNRVKDPYRNGKFFLFLPLTKTTAYKIMCRGTLEDLKTVIRVQKTLAKNGFSPDCGEEVLEFFDGFNTYYGYLTNIIYPDKDVVALKTWAREVVKCCSDNKIHRRSLSHELIKDGNWVLRDGKYWLIDIDPNYMDLSNLDEELIKHGQFPYGRRKVPYQDTTGIKGTRNTEHRMPVFNLPTSFVGKTVLDLGCNLGAMCVEACNRGAPYCIGVDFQPETIRVGKKYVCREGYSRRINLLVSDVDKMRSTFQFNFVFAFSIIGHVKTDNIYKLIDNCTKESCWIEGHNKVTTEFMHNLLSIKLPRFKINHLGTTTDRGTRQCFRLDKITQ